MWAIKHYSVKNSGPVA